jgi:hypothetical protein
VFDPENKKSGPSRNVKAHLGCLAGVVKGKLANQKAKCQVAVFGQQKTKPTGSDSVRALSAVNLKRGYD